MHEMQTIVTDVCNVCLSVCVSVTRLISAERIKILFVLNTPGDLRNIDFSFPDPPTVRGIQCSLHQITFTIVYFCAEVLYIYRTSGHICDLGNLMAQ